MNRETYRPVAQPLPASGSKLIAALDQALNQIEGSEEASRRANPIHLSLWKEILLQSKKLSTKGVAPNLLKGDVASSIAVRLTGRQWSSFEKWFNQTIAPELQLLAAKSKVPAIRPVRIADRKGGYPDQSEAILYIAYVEKIGAIADSSAAIESPSQQIDAKKSLAVSEELTVCNSDDAQKTADIAAAQRHKPLSDNHTPHSKNDEKANSRWRFGLSMLLMGTFLAVVAEKMIPESHRSMFIGFSVVLAILGLWDMDRANKGISR